MTVLELIRSSLRLIQEMKPGQGPNTDDVTDALFNLNLMLEAWSIDRNNIFRIARDQYPLTAGLASYTIGRTGGLDGRRPNRIENAAYLAGGVEYPLQVIHADEWALIRIKDISPSIPQKLYSDGAWPSSTVYLYPAPIAAEELVLYTWQALSSGFTAVTDCVSMPPGYADAIRYNLAVRLAPEWGRVLRADVESLARDSKAEIQRLNLPAPTLSCDPAIRNAGRSSRYFDYLTGQ